MSVVRRSTICVCRRRRVVVHSLGPFTRILSSIASCYTIYRRRERESRIIIVQSNFPACWFVCCDFLGWQCIYSHQQVRKAKFDLQTTHFTPHTHNSWHLTTWSAAAAAEYDQQNGNMKRIGIALNNWFLMQTTGCGTASVAWWCPRALCAS